MRKSMRKRNLLCLTCLAAALALLAAAALPAWAAAEQQVQQLQKEWQVIWREEGGWKNDSFIFGKRTQAFIPPAEAVVTFSLGQQSAGNAVVGNAVLVRVRIGRSTGYENSYVVYISTPQEGVKLAPVAPTLDVFSLGPIPGPPEIHRDGFAYVFTRPVAASDGAIRIVLPAGQYPKVPMSTDQWWVAEFLAPGEHVFTVTVQRNGQVVKREAVTIPVAPGRGSYRVHWDFQPFGVSMGLQGAQNAQEVQEYLSRIIASAQVSFRADGDLRFEPQGTFSLPLNGTAVWTRLVAANTDMPTGRAELVTEVQYQPKKPDEYHYSIGYQGSLLPQVTLSNLPTLPTPGGPGSGPGSGGWGYWPALPAAGAAPIVLGWALSRRSVDVWLEAESGTVFVRRGRRGPGRVRAVLSFTGTEEDARRELVLRRGEAQEVKLPEDWRTVEVATPGRRNRGQPVRLEREASDDVRAQA